MKKKTDWILGVYKGLDILCSIIHGIEGDRGRPVDTFELAFELMKEDPSSFSGRVTHIYGIDQYKTAFSTASRKGQNGAIKVAFRFDL